MPQKKSSFIYCACLWLMCFCFLKVSVAQQPAYFMLGDNQFRGVKIYKVIQDKDLNYWFATNEGLYMYDYYSFQKVDCPDSKSNAMFNFVMNEDGTIYCHNLNNQIFKIKNKQCSVLYELKNDEESSDISLAIGDDGNLLVSSRVVLVFNRQEHLIVKHFDNFRHLSEPFCTEKNGLQYHMDGRDSVLIYSNGNFLKHKINFYANQEAHLNLLVFFNLKDVVYAVDRRSKAQYVYSPITFELKQIERNIIFERSEAMRIYETGNEVWVAGTLPGAVMLNAGNFKTNKDIYYSNYFVSDVYKDHEGNILISTFDKGVIVIPDLSVPDVINTFTDDPIVSLFSAGSEGLFLGSSKGILWNYHHGVFVEISSSGNRPIEGVYGSNESELILFDNGSVHAYNKRTKKFINIVKASLKDAVFISKNKFYLATNGGVIECTWDGKDNISITRPSNVKSRTYFLAYNSKDTILYAATNNGLVYKAPSRFDSIKYNTESIFASSLHFNRGKLFVSDNKNNLLVIEGKKIRQSIRPMFAGKAEAITKLTYVANSFIGKSSNGLFQFDTTGKVLKIIYSSFDFTSHKVYDYAFHNGMLFVSHTGGVQQIDLKHNNGILKNPTLSFSQILINDKQINFQKTSEFKHQENKFQFILSYPTLRNKDGIQYHYQLQGLEDKWNVNKHDENKITYNALAPGNYTLLVKVENQNMAGNAISYSFSISKPFYATFLFIAFCVVIFLVVVFEIYRWQLKIQRKKAEQQYELSASKLTAIQSQMNPHFIFNSLNSIQDLVLKGDVENSYSYITTFSELVRRTLNYSQKDFVEFEQEIKLLNLYLSLEKLRFKENFTYEISYENSDDIMIPPMLIQPFIENSLVHGLLHKDGDKKLKVYFELGDKLICKIEDNGIGRAKSKAIKERQNTSHESFAGKAIGRRLEILSNVFEGEFGFSYEDIYEGQVFTGTRVILSIPMKRKF